MSAGEGRADAPFKPTPPAATALILRAVQGNHGQWTIRNGPGSLGGEFERYYVELSGYCGEHNPRVFAAAPEMLKALEAEEAAWAARDDCDLCDSSEDWSRCPHCSLRFGKAIDLRRAAIAKARGYK